MRFWLRTPLFFIIIIVLTLLTHFKAYSAPMVEVTESDVDYRFGEQIIFKASIDAQAPIEQVSLYIQVQGEQAAEVGSVSLSSHGRVVSIYDASRGALRAFSKIAYWYQITLENGSSFTSPEFWFDYEDNRFEWNTLAEGVFRVHWHSNNPAIAQEVIQVSQNALHTALNYILVLPPDVIDIYIYENTEDMQISLQQLGRSLVSGHASPALGVVLVSLPPGPDQSLLMMQRIPHEIMHILTYQVVGDAYSKLPIWLIEGLASIAELNPSQEYQVLIEDAYRRNALMPMSSLCQIFPLDASGALLAYAQSASFTQYIHKNYGTQGIMNLLMHYSSGLGCEQGIEKAFEIRFNRLENQWRRDTFNGKSWIYTAEKVIPWVILLVSILFAPTFLAANLLLKREENDRK